MKPSRYIFAAITVVIAFGLGLVVGIFATRAYEVPTESHKLKKYGYVLFTWKGHSGDLCFALIPKYKSWKFENNLFSKWNGMCGIATLKDELTELPKGTYVEWNNSPSWQFSYPDRKTVQGLDEFASSVGLDFHENPALDVKTYSDYP